MVTKRRIYNPNQPTKYQKLPQLWTISPAIGQASIGNSTNPLCQDRTGSSIDSSEEPQQHDDSADGDSYNQEEANTFIDDDGDDEDLLTEINDGIWNDDEADFHDFNRLLLTATDRAMLALIQLCNKAGTPISFFDKLIRILKEHTALGFEVNKAPSRSKFMERLRKKFPYNKAKEIATPSCHDLFVPKFSFLDQIHDLLSSKYFQFEKYCCVNTDENAQYLKYQPPLHEEGLSDLVGGKWYHQTYDQLIGDCPTFFDVVSNRTYHNWLVPVIFYNDKTGVSAMEGSYSLEPLMFTLGVIKRTYRENDDAWRHLGFIPTRNAGSSPADIGSLTGAEQSLAITHECLEILLSDLAKLQADPPLLSLNIFGRKQRHVRLILEVAFVIGDQLSQDTHCCRKKINGGGAGRIHRSCMTSFLHAHEGGCTPISKQVLDNLCDHVWLWEDKKKLKSFVESTHPIPVLTRGPRDPLLLQARKLQQQLESRIKTQSQVAREILEKTFSTYPIDNAWSAISFGANMDGIYRATLDDPMHYNSSGLFQYLAEISFKGLLPAEAKELEKFMREDSSKRSSVRYDLPRGKFFNGFTNCTLLTASEKVGLMYALYLGLGTPRIANIFQGSILRQQKKYVDMSCFNDMHGTCDDDSSGSSSSLEGSTRPPSLSELPKVVDRFFPKKPTSIEKQNADVMPRTRQAVREMVDDLNRQGLLKAVEPHVECFDSIQTEYFLQAIWSRVTKKGSCRTTALPILHPPLTEANMVDGAASKKIADRLFSRLHRVRAGANSSNISGRDLVPFTHDFSTVQPKIKKHGVDKGNIKGRGDTTAILTNVPGYRNVLELALIFHAIVHEFHELDSQLQNKFSELQSKIDTILNSILSQIYRGDNSYDVLTCKCHAHFHLVKDIEYYGAPMGFDAAKGERNLKAWAKQISKTARKCGHQTFVRQTASRVSDHQLLRRADSIIDIQEEQRDREVAADQQMTENKWNYTRKKCHMRYNLQTREVVLDNEDTTSYVKDTTTYSNAECHKLLTSPVTKLLHELHGHEGIISIWKEIKVDLGCDGGGAKHYVRAFHDFDVHGPYFDWVHIQDDKEVQTYKPAKVVLLYQFQKRDCALVWKAKTATEAERRLETNLSARWRMELLPSGLPYLVSVPIEYIEKCILVHEHWRCINGNQLPSTELQPGTESSTFVIDEAYDRYSWALNFLDDGRW